MLSNIGAMYFYRYWCNIGNVGQCCILAYCPNIWDNITFVGTRRLNHKETKCWKRLRLIYISFTHQQTVTHPSTNPASSAWPVVELSSCWSRVRRPNHCIKPHKCWRNKCYPILAQCISTDIGATLVMLADVAYIAPILAQYHLHWPT